MRKILLGISVILLFVGAEAKATPFLTQSGVNVTTVLGTWDVSNEAWVDDDIWDPGKDAFYYDTTSTTAGYLEYSGYYLGTFTGKGNNANTDEATLETLAGYYLDTPVNANWYKVDAPGTTNGLLLVTYYTGNQSGKWETTAVNPVEYVSFYAIKAGNQFAFYLVDPAATSGFWSTIHVPVGNNDNTPTISHLDVLTNPGNPIPEPATMLLFGTGLIGLAGVARRKR